MRIQKRHGAILNDVQTHLFRARKVCALLLALVILGVPSVSPADHDHEHTTMEYRLKAAFIYNFAKFVEWPAEVNRLTAIRRTDRSPVRSQSV